LRLARSECRVYRFLDLDRRETDGAMFLSSHAPSVALFTVGQYNNPCYLFCRAMFSFRKPSASVASVEATTLATTPADLEAEALAALSEIL
jgi:hypothetical protein